jgi:hypothetical protein
MFSKHAKSPEDHSSRGIPDTIIAYITYIQLSEVHVDLRHGLLLLLLLLS